jgi:amidase
MTDDDAPAVKLLRDAGAIILGKTNCAEMAMDYNGDNPVFGRTFNPHDASRTPGGSSAGEAVAIDTCMSPGGLGSDLAGSIRIPAHFCGVCGLKPTVGRINGDGQFPEADGMYALGAVVGPMARSVADLHLLCSVMAAHKDPHPLNWGIHRFKNLSHRFTPLSQVRDSIKGAGIAYYTDDCVVPVSDETINAVHDAAKALADAGFNVQEKRPPGIERGHELWLKLFSHTSVRKLRELYQGWEHMAGDFVRWRLRTDKASPELVLKDEKKGMIGRAKLHHKLTEWMEGIPLLLAPVGAVPAFEHDAHKVTVNGQTFSTFRAFSYAQTFNVLDLPVAVVPAGRSKEGLPIGVQIAGRPFAEDTVLAAAEVIEAALGGWQPPPDLFVDA